MHDHVPTGPSRFLINNNADVRHTSAKIPADQVPGRIVFRAIGDRQRFSLTLEENHQIGHPAMIDVGIWMGEVPPSPSRIRREVLQHVFVDFFLQINPHRPIGTNDLVGADARVGRDVSPWVWNSDVGGNVPDGVMRSLGGGRNEATQKFLAMSRRVVRLRHSAGQKYGPHDNWNQPP
jgi:hypothetical protein